MKFFLLVSLVCLKCNLQAEGRVIVNGSYVSSQKLKIKIFSEINGYYNMAFFSYLKINDFKIQNLDSFNYRAKINGPTSILLYVTTDDEVFVTKCLLMLFPNDSVHLKMDLTTESKESITYTGSNSAGHKLFNDIDYNPLYKYEGLINVLKHLPNNKSELINSIDTSVAKFTDQFQNLFSQQSISMAYNNYVKVVFKQLLYNYANTKLLYNYKERDIYTKRERDSIVKQLYSKLPISNSFINSAYDSYLYLVQYYNFLNYKKYNLNSIEELFDSKRFVVNGKKYFVENECSQFFYIKNAKIRADLWALFMLNLMPMYELGKFDHTIAQFKKIYPNSKWNKILEIQAGRLLKTTNNKYTLQSPIIYIDSSDNINTLKELLNQLPAGRAIFLDLWASWCGPCLKAFQANIDLDTFLLTNKILRLYVSLDYPENTQGWIKTIKKYALGGYHILPKKSVIDDIKAICNLGQSDPVSIPRYMLISKDKRVVINNAISPLNLRLLKQQIKNT
jgi:thiol-disulfide isomerase/thioredoxin